MDSSSSLRVFLPTTLAAFSQYLEESWVAVSWVYWGPSLMGGRTWRTSGSGAQLGHSKWLTHMTAPKQRWPIWCGRTTRVRASGLLSLITCLCLKEKEDRKCLLLLEKANGNWETHELRNEMPNSFLVTPFKDLVRSQWVVRSPPFSKLQARMTEPSAILFYCPHDSAIFTD